MRALKAHNSKVVGEDVKHGVIAPTNGHICAALRVELELDEGVLLSSGILEFEGGGVVPRRPVLCPGVRVAGPVDVTLRGDEANLRRILIVVDSRTVECVGGEAGKEGRDGHCLEGLLELRHGLPGEPEDLTEFLWLGLADDLGRNFPTAFLGRLGRQVTGRVAERGVIVTGSLTSRVLTRGKEGC